MIRAACIRGGELLFVAFGVSVLTFLMIHLVPGDAAQIMLGANDVAPEQIAATAPPARPRPAAWLRNIWPGSATPLRGDLGTSVWTGRPVAEEIAGRVGVTVELTVLGMALAIVLAIPAGCLMATLRARPADYVVRLLSIAGVTVPSFWLGTMLLYGARRCRAVACRWSAGCRSPRTRWAICSACCCR